MMDPQGQGPETPPNPTPPSPQPPFGSVYAPPQSEDVVSAELVSPPALPSAASPWRFWATIGFMLLGLIVYFVASSVVGGVYVAYLMATRQLDLKELLERGPGGEKELESRLLSDGFAFSSIAIAGLLSWMAVAALAVYVSRYPWKEYLGWKAVSLWGTVRWLSIVVVLMVLFDGASLLLGREVVPQFMKDGVSAPAALPLIFLAVVLVAPVCEELLFRGFAFRGLETSWLRPVGTILVTSVCWAALHVQYDFYGISQVFLIGLLLGWMRFRTGSTILTIYAHMLNNFLATVETIVIAYLL